MKLLIQGDVKSAVEGEDEYQPDLSFSSSTEDSSSSYDEAEDGEWPILSAPTTATTSTITSSSIMRDKQTPSSRNVTSSFSSSRQQHRVKFADDYDDLWSPDGLVLDHAGATADELLRNRLENMYQKLMQTQIDLGAERALRRRKEKIVLKLAKELAKRTLKCERKNEQIEKMAASLRDADCKMQAVMVVATSKMSSHKQSQKDCIGLTECKKFFEHTARQLQEQVVQLQKEKQELALLLAEATTKKSSERVDGDVKDIVVVVQSEEDERVNCDVKDTVVVVQSEKNASKAFTPQRNALHYYGVVVLMLVLAFMSFRIPLPAGGSMYQDILGGNKISGGLFVVHVPESLTAIVTTRVDDATSSALVASIGDFDNNGDSSQKFLSNEVSEDFEENEKENAPKNATSWFGSMMRIGKRTVVGRMKPRASES